MPRNLGSVTTLLFPHGNSTAGSLICVGVSVDTLLGVETSKRRAKASDTRLTRPLQEIDKLAPTEKRQILQIIDTFIERGQLKRKVGNKPPA